MTLCNDKRYLDVIEQLQYYVILKLQTSSVKFTEFPLEELITAER